jgi:O-antigen/teichoic acid export membrane protein
VEPPEKNVPNPAGEDGESLSTSARKNFGFAVINQILLRAANFAGGLILARLLTQADFGVVAVGLLVLQLMLTFNDLGLTSAIVRAKDHELRATANTILSISLVISSVAYVLCFTFAEPFARLLLSSDDVAAGRLSTTVAIIRVLCLSLLVDTIAGVPGALLTRELQEKRRMRAELAGLGANLPLTVALAAAGAGPWALVAGRLSGAFVVAVGLYLLAPYRPRPGWDRALVPGLVRFGIPMVGATILGYLALNSDYLVIGKLLGATVLGAYTLAYNMAKWPEGVFAMAIHRTALPAFARLRDDKEALQRTYTKVMWLLATAMAPLSGLLGLLAHDVVLFAYGAKWSTAAIALEFLAVLGFFSVLTNLGADMLISYGRSRGLMVAEFFWLVALVPALIIGVQFADLRGVGLAHGLVVVFVAVPSYVWMLSRDGISHRGLPRLLVRPAIATAALLAAGSFARMPFESPFLRLLFGGTAGLLAYTVVVLPRSPLLDTYRQIRSGSSITEPGAPDGGAGAARPALLPEA